MRTLTGVSITFDTHDDNKDDTTAVHVFVKNRLNSSRTPEGHGDFVSNWLDHLRYQDDGDLVDERNPYLAVGLGLGVDTEFEDPSSATFDLALTSDAIDVDQIVLPAASIHILSDGDDRWIFDYTVAFAFDDSNGGSGSFSFTSDRDGIAGIVLDQDNRDHYGILAENPLHAPLVPDVPVTDAILDRVTIEFATHNDNKDFDTHLNVHVVNRLSATSAQDLAIGLDVFPDEEFPDAGAASPLSVKKFSWSSSPTDAALASDAIRLADIMLPVVYIMIVPNGDDRWIFDYRVTFEFADPRNYHLKRYVYSSRTNGVILDQDNNKHEGVYQGRPFPTVSPPTAPPLTLRPVDHTAVPKMISLPLLQRKLDEFVNLRTGGLAEANPPLRRVRLHNAGRFGEDTTPESYLDVQSLNAGKGSMTFVSGPSSLGQFTVATLGFFLRDINSSALNLTVDASGVTPLRLDVAFETEGPQELGAVDTPDIDFVRFALSLGLTLDLTRTTDRSGHEITVVDLFSWIDDLATIQSVQGVDPADGKLRLHHTGTWLRRPFDVWSIESHDAVLARLMEQVLLVDLATSSAFDPGDEIHGTIVSAIYGKLTSPDLLTKQTAREAVNSQVTSWLLGGVADDDHNTDENNTVIHDMGIQNANPEFGIPEDSLVISYTGPRHTFVPTTPPDWPTAHAPNPAHDFSPATLANIDHIVVLTMENRSFDHMLGYLSLPREQGGASRSDVDGLKGNESNVYQGKTFPTFPLTETLFAPDPPHGYEPVHQAINGGAMDGFVKSFAEAHGDRIAGQIMGHHTAATVPVYDALARDFAIGHRWFASHPGPTFCNRFYELTGRLNLDTRGFWEFDNSSPVRPVFTPTIFDYLSGADPVTGEKLTWNYFEHGYCFLRFFESHTFDQTRIVDVDDPQSGFFALAREGRLPHVSFIDPHFVELPPGADADGPPADVALGQAFVSRVVEAVVSGPAWEKTLLVIVYDEHGGFYDHVAPPKAPRVSPDLAIDTYGVRVPVFLVSPWVRPGAVFGHDGTATHPDRTLYFDHTSILKTIARRFLSTAPPYLGPRYAAAKDLSAAIGTHLHKPQFRPFLRYNLRFLRSHLMLDVQFANPAPGTLLWQFPANGTVAQDFSFEDAGHGYVYIRAHVSNLYLTVQEPATAGGAAAQASLSIIQDVKYPAGAAGSGTPARRGALQRWKVTPVGISQLSRHDHVIASEAYPERQLQPADPSQAEAPIVLGKPGHGPPSGQSNVWRITSPLLPDGGGNHP
jgi:phospholipase C